MVQVSGATDQAEENLLLGFGVSLWKKENIFPQKTNQIPWNKFAFVNAFSFVEMEMESSLLRFDDGIKKQYKNVISNTKLFLIG